MWQQRTKFIVIFIFMAGLSIFLYDQVTALTSETPERILLPLFKKQWQKTREAEVKANNLPILMRIQTSYFHSEDCFANLTDIYHNNYHSEVEIDQQDWKYYQKPQETFQGCDFVMYQAKPLPKYDAYLRDYAAGVVSSKLLDSKASSVRAISLICREKEIELNSSVSVVIDGDQLRCSENAELYD